MRGQCGVSLVELLAVMAILGVIVGTAGLYLKPMEAPLNTGAEGLDALFRQARARGMATTSAYRVSPEGPGRIRAEYAESCLGTTWTTDPRVALELPEQVSLADLTWSVCFSSRGIADTNEVVTLTHPDFGTARVEVMLGGTTRILP